MGYFKKLEIERMDNYKLREAEDFEDGVIGILCLIYLQKRK